VHSNSDEHSNKGLVLEIQRMSTEDGPGLRTTVFFKGCSLKCAWCHNPESISLLPQIHWIGSRCIGCRTCLDTCSQNALCLSRKGIGIDRDVCDGCGRCVEECPSTALELLGEEWHLDDLVKEVLKDRVYFEKSNGGVTVSGGEPTIQADFAAEFLRQIRGRGIKTALDTCGLCSARSLDQLLPHANLVLFDLKEINPQKHLEFTGSDNRAVLENLIHVAEFIDSHLFPEKLWIRTPLIPGATDTVENLKGIGAWIEAHLDQKVDRWELCAFNNLCRDKYARLGLNWQFEDAELLEAAHIQHLLSVAQSSGVNPDIVFWSGSTRLTASETENEFNRSGLKVVP
jgi:pyruvate formate lyase activating enzyme